jgi:hypothetical protein
MAESAAFSSAWRSGVIGLADDKIGGQAHEWVGLGSRKSIPPLPMSAGRHILSGRGRPTTHGPCPTVRGPRNGGRGTWATERRGELLPTASPRTAPSKDGQPLGGTLPRRPDTNPWGELRERERRTWAPLSELDERIRVWLVGITVSSLENCSVFNVRRPIMGKRSGIFPLDGPRGPIGPSARRPHRPHRPHRGR